MRYRKLGLLGLASSAKAAKGRAKKFVESRPRWLVVGLAVAVFAAVGGGTAFAVRLAPAWYRISLAPPPLSGHVTPARVRAPRKGVARLRLEIRP